MFYIDGMECDVICEIERITEVKASDLSGMLLDNSFFNDVLGSFLQYTITIKVPLNKMDTYGWIYEKLSEPVDGHEFILPYNSGTITITARVESVSDKFATLPGGRKYWKDTTFTVIANHPSREMELSEIISRGRSPLPDVAEPKEGDTYTYRNGAWGPAESYMNADDIRY